MTTEESYLQVLRDVCTVREWSAICRKAVADAEQGDARARAWLSDYLLGKPVMHHQHTGDGDGVIHVVHVDGFYGDQTDELERLTEGDDDGTSD